MPPVFAAIAVVAGAIGTGVTFGLATGALAVEIGTTVLLTATSIGLGFVEKALIGKPKIPSLAGQQSQQITSRQAVAPWPVYYGRNRVGGIITYISVTGTKGEFLNIVITIAGHLIHSIDALYFDGVQVPLNGSGDCVSGNFAFLVHAEFNFGLAAQSAFPGLVAADSNWATTSKQSGRAGAFVQLKYSADKFPNSIPNITFDIKGKPVFDPRTGETAYVDSHGTLIGENPALCIRDYLTNGNGATVTQYGLGAPSSEINDASFIVAANNCDETIALKSGGTLSGGGNQRYLCNGGFTVDQKPVDILNQLLSSMAGYLTWNGGKWSVFAGVWRGPATVTLTDDDLRGPVKLQILASKSDLANRITGAIINASPGGVPTWKPMDFPPYCEDTAHGFGSDQWLAQDNGERLDQQIQLPFTIDSAMAQRIAKITLERIRRQVRATWPCKISAYAVQPPDVIQITRSRYGWVNKTFEVTQSVLSLEPDDQGAPLPAVDLSLRETDSGVYAWNPAFEELPDPAPGNVALPNPSTVPALTGATLSTVRTTRADGSLATYIRVAWTAPTGIGAQQILSGGHIVIQYAVQGTGNWKTAATVAGDATSYDIGGVSEGASYDVQIYALSSSGASSVVEQVLNFTVGDAITYFVGGTIGNSLGKSLLGNGGFEQNISQTPIGTNLAVNADCTDDWLVASISPYHTVKLDSTTTHSGGNALFIDLNVGSVPSDNQQYTAMVYSRTKYPVVIGDIVRISGWMRWDNSVAFPAGVTFEQVLDVEVYAADDTALLNLTGAFVQRLGSGTGYVFTFMQGAVQIPSLVAGKIPAYIRVRCFSFVINNSGSALVVNGANVYAEHRWDDLKLVIQNTAFDLTPINTAWTVVGANPLSAPVPGTGTTAIINIAAFTAQFGDGQISYNSGSITNLNASTLYFVYCDDPTFSGGSVTYHATTNNSDVNAANGRLFCGFITTPAVGGTAATGKGDGNGSCFTENTRIQGERGQYAIAEHRDGDSVLTSRGLRPARLITHEYEGELIDMGEGEGVTPGHRFRVDGEWLRADELFPENRRFHFAGKVCNLQIDTDDEEERNYMLANGWNVHNVRKL